MPSESIRTLVFGGGNMARAIIEGAIEAGVCAADRWLVVDPGAGKRAHFAGMGAAAFQDPRAAIEALGGEDELLLAVKPQVFPELARTIASDVGDRRVISIMAGVGSDSIRQALGGVCRVVRAMPNTPVRVRQGLTWLARGVGSTEADMVSPAALFGALGQTLEIPEELINAGTAVAGSGPAYVFRIAEAMESGALAVGLSAEEARLAVAQTLRGAAALLNEPGADPAALREAVTSRGGTTAAGLSALEAGGVDDVFRAVILAARDRGVALGTSQEDA